MRVRIVIVSEVASINVRRHIRQARLPLLITIDPGGIPHEASRERYQTAAKARKSLKMCLKILFHDDPQRGWF